MKKHAGCFLALAFGLGLHLSSGPACAATVDWTGAGDGVSWSQPNNWAPNVLPNASDDAVVSGFGTSVTIVIETNVTIRSLQCSASLHVSEGNLTLTQGASQVAGTLTVASGRALITSGPSTTFTAHGLTAVDGASLYARNGAVLELPGIGQAVRTSNNEAMWQAEDAGSRLVLAGLTNLVGYLNGGWWRIQAYNGGRVELPAVTTLSNGWFQVYADGMGAVVDLSKLTAFELGRADHYLILEARNQGSVLVPQFRDGKDATVTLRSGGTMSTGQFTRVQQITLDGVTASFSALASVDDTSLYVQNGAVLELPGIGQAVRTSNNEAMWQAEDAGSRLVLAGLTNLVGYLNGGWWRIQAYNGGRVELPAVTALSNGWFQVYADGIGAVVDLSKLTAFELGRADHYLILEARNQGSVLVPQFRDGKDATVTLRSGGTMSTGQFTRVQQITLDGVTASFSALASVDDTSLYVQNGAVLELPGIGQAVRTSNNEAMWQAEDPGSRLVLAGLTNLVGYLNGGWWRIQAYNGGRVELPAVTTLSNGWFQVYADGIGAVVDLSKLTAFELGRADHYLILEARNQGSVLVPQFRDGKDATVTLRSGGTMSTGQFTRVQQITLDGVTASFSALASVDDTSLYVQNGAVLELPGIGQAVRTSNNEAMWRAEDAGSRLVLAGLTNLVGYLNGGWWRIQAYNGGRVELPAVTALSNGWFQVYADGIGAVVDLSKLTAFELGRADHYLILEARNQGSVLVPQFRDGKDATVTLRSGGTMSTGQFTRVQQITLDGVTASFSALASVDDTSLYVQNGAVLELPGIGQAVRTSNNEAMWRAEDAGSRLVLAGLTNLVGYLNGGWWRIQAYNGGRVELPAVTALSNGWFQVHADGIGAVVDLSGLADLTVSAGRQVLVQARNRGFINLRTVQNIAGGSCSIIADGDGSVVDLSSLSSFATPVEASELTARNGGTILLSGSVFLLANVAVQIDGHPVLPPVVSEGPALSLYGRAWHSYRVESRDTREPTDTWALLKRVPLTNDLQVIGGPPAPWQAFRVWEFVADPAILDTRHEADGEVDVVLYGTPAKAYEVRSTDQLDASFAGWPWWNATGLMTNSFRIFPSFAPLVPPQFFRAKEQ